MTSHEQLHQILLLLAEQDKFNGSLINPYRSSEIPENINYTDFNVLALKIQEILKPQSLFMAIIQPDGDWDHVADVVGVFSTPALAKQANTGYGPVLEVYKQRLLIKEVEIDVPVKS